VTDLTIDCLRSIAPRIDRLPGTRVAVCENGTGGDAAERLERAIAENGWGRWADLTVLPVNLGFTGGNNAVVRPALASADPPDYVLLLNADTIVQDGSFERLVEFMDRHPRAGVAGSKLVWPDGEAQSSPFRHMGVRHAIGYGLRSSLVNRLLRNPVAVWPKPRAPRRVDWVSGASMILRRTMLDEIGLLDEGLYTYFDDIDVCLRAQRAGWQTWFVPESVVVHLEARSTGLADGSVKRRPAYWFQARRRFLLKSYGAARTAVVDGVFLASYAFQRGVRTLLRRVDPDPAHFFADFVRHSVFGSGFRVRAVENPAFAKGAAPRPSGAAVARPAPTAAGAGR
jgi:GT2 family glycosyltransferase